VRRHAGPGAHAFVQLAWETDALIAIVSDDGRGAAAADDGKGQGLLGMRERAAMFGGTLTAGPKAGGGYVVRARLPMPHVSQAAA
jgi:signal transduction histidine kinase